MKKISIPIYAPKRYSGFGSAPSDLTYRNIEKMFEDRITDIIIPPLISLNKKEFPINSPESPFINILSEEEWRKVPISPQTIFRQLQHNENVPSENIHMGRKVVAPHFTIFMKSKRIICCFLLETANTEKVHSLLADIEAIRQKRLAPICIIRDESIRSVVVNALHGRVFFPIINEKDFIFLMRAMMFETQQSVKNNRILPSFMQIVSNLHNIASKWPLGYSREQSLQVMRMMGMQVRQQPDKSVFRKGGSWKSVGKKKMNEIHVGIVGMGDRGINMLKRSVDRGTYKQPKEKRVMDIVAICDIDSKALKKAVKKANLKKIPESDRPRIYTSLEKFLQDPEINIVKIVVPATIDQEVAREVVKAGKSPMIIVKDGDPRSGRGPVRI